MPDFILTDDNYYSREADIWYMSCSQFQQFEKCEAAAIAKLHGRWEPDETPDALLQGQYFHSAMESEEAFARFCEENREKIYKTKTVTDKATKLKMEVVTGKYAPFERLDEMLNVTKEDPQIKRILSWPGENEKFMTGKIGGIPWRMKMDKYAVGRRIIDYKTTANIWETYYDQHTKQRVSFIEEYGYMMRAAVYGEIERQNAGADTFPSFMIIAISKQDPPDKDIFLLNDDDRWMFELEKVKAKLPRIQRLKEGAENPRRCGMCEYCRSTKKIKRVKQYTDLMPEFRNDPDNVEYDDYEGTSVFDTL